jgi:hypothetical protein
MSRGIAEASASLPDPDTRHFWPTRKTVSGPVTVTAAWVLCVRDLDFVSRKLSQEEKLGEIKGCNAGRDGRAAKYLDIPQTNNKFRKFP